MVYKPKILVLGLGGTWCMPCEKASEVSQFDNEMVARALGEDFDIEREFPKLGSFCEPAFVEFEAIDSSNMDVVHWRKAAHYIMTNRDRYDGFVVMQGTDTLAFTSAALAFALQGLHKPVVISGAQIAMYVAGSDAPLNVVNSCRVAALGEHSQGRWQSLLHEVLVVFGSRIIRATRARKYSERDLEAFASVNVPDVGCIRTSIRIDGNMLLQSNRATAPTGGPHADFDEGVVMLHLYPGCSPQILLDTGKRSSGIVLAAFGAGNIPCNTDSCANPKSLENPIRQLTEAGIPVVITTQCVTGQAEVGKYETGSKAREAGAIIANDMTPEVAFIKLSWLLANRSMWPRKAIQAMRGGPGLIGGIRHAMVTDYAGEITENLHLYGVLSH